MAFGAVATAAALKKRVDGCARASGALSSDLRREADKSAGLGELDDDCRLGAIDQHHFRPHFACRFVWNVWSTFIYPKAKVRVSFDMVQIVEMGSDWTPSVLRLSATNMGPGEITLSNALITYRGPFNQSNGFGLLSTLADFPRLQDHTKGYLGAGFPAKLAVGEQYSAYLVPAHHALAKGDYQRIGFTDSFGRSHWAPRRDILHALHSIRDACEKAGINWRAPV